MVGMKTRKKTTLLWNDSEKERLEDYPTSVAYQEYGSSS